MDGNTDPVEVLRQASIGTHVEADIIRTAVRAVVENASDEQIVEIAKFAFEKGIGQ